MHVDQVGSCTTLLVEELRDHNGNLTVLQATLLLLGIYEDTGSLAHVSTTSRDVRAAAYLLEQGASLQIAADYLNPPLSAEQRRIYDQLLAAVTAYQIQGQNILVATGSRGMNEEISSVAHKIRDLLDPDGLFLLVQTDEGSALWRAPRPIRWMWEPLHLNLAAADMAGCFCSPQVESTPDGKSPTLEEVSTHLVERLKRIGASFRHCRTDHAASVVLSPDTSAQDAAALMQRYGYEGYPVVRDGKVIGLLTRRAVDRALAHKLNLAAVSLMDAGEVSVVPSDPLEHLQRLMASWVGSDPGMSPEDGSVIGCHPYGFIKGHGQAAASHTRADQLERPPGTGITPSPDCLPQAASLTGTWCTCRCMWLVDLYVTYCWKDPAWILMWSWRSDASLLGKALHRKYGGRLSGT